MGFAALLGGTEIGGAHLDCAGIALLACEVGEGAFGKCYGIVGVDVKSLIRDGQFLACGNRADGFPLSDAFDFSPAVVGHFLIECKWERAVGIA